MTTSLLFSLKGTKIFSKNRLEAHNELKKNMLNSMLYFDELFFEDGVSSVSYGDSGTFQITGPYEGLEKYNKFKDGYIKDAEKTPFMLSAYRNDQEIPLLDTEAYSFFASFEGELASICENYSGKELDFIKIVHPDEIKLGTLEKRSEDSIRSQMSINDYPTFIKPVIEKWNFPIIACGVSFRETINAVSLAEGFKGKLLLDPFHNAILNFTLNYFSKELKYDKTPYVLTKIIPLLVPDYSVLDIERIIELRENPAIVEFRRTISKISNEIKDVEDIDGFIQSLWTNELLDDLKQPAPPTRTKFLLNSIIDLGLSIPATDPHLSIIQLVVGLSKWAYDTNKDYDELVRHDKRLAHFCSELRQS